MPLGPRPEPPVIPRKEPRHHIYVHPLASQSALQSPTPAVPPKGPIPPSSSSSSINSLSSTLSTSSRLKGPRPISPGRSRKAVPSPVATRPVSGSPCLPYPEADEPWSVGSPFSGGSRSPLSAGSSNSGPPSGDESIRMPEPEYSVGSIPSLSPLTVSSSSSDTVVSRAYHRMVPTNELDPRPTHSIFQWGVPSELLPPTPMPVDAMSGLQIGKEGHYTMRIDLPEISPLEPVRPKFSVEQLTVSDFSALGQLWSLNATAKWIYDLVIAYDAEILVEDTVQALTKLYLYRIATLEWKMAEKIARSAIRSLQLQHFIASNKGTLILQTVPAVSGVITLLSGDGCYSLSRAHHPPNSRCYSSRCLREPHTLLRTVTHASQRQSSSRQASLRKVSVGDSPVVLDSELLDPFAAHEMNWRKFWSLEEVDIGEIDPKLVKLQFALHELILSEVSYVRDLRIYLEVYGEIEIMQGLNIMENQDEFIRRVFDKVRAVLTTNERLLAQLLLIQQQQGPYINSLGTAIADWATDSKTMDAYTRYSDNYLWADNHLRKNLANNQRLQKWMEERAKDPRLTGRPHSFFFHRVLPRVARYQLLLGAVLKYMPETGEKELQEVQKSIDNCNTLTQECDDRVAKQKVVLDVQNLKAHIVFKSSSVAADLKLGDKRRKLIRKGNMTRRGDMKMDWVETHALLLDNFFVMSKIREGMNGTAFYITKPPVPLDLLVVESADEEPVTKVTSRLTITRHGGAAAAAAVQEEMVPNPDNDRNPVLFPIKITHLGSGGRSYVLFVPNQPERGHWVRSIIEAKQSRAQLAFARSAEPFKLEKISDQFAYPEYETIHLPVPIPDTPLHRAVLPFDINSLPQIALRRHVNCLISAGSLYLAGTDNGLWIGQPNGAVNGSTENCNWRCITSVPSRIVKLEMLDTMNLLFVLCGDHNLIWYPLDQLISRGLGDRRKALGVRLNQQRKVADFAIEYHKGRVVVMYLQHGGQLKVIEPIRSHGAVPMQSLLENSGLIPAASCVDSFREVDRMTVSTDTIKVTPFLKSLVLTSTKTFDWVSLDTKTPLKIPSGRTSKEMQHWGGPIRIIKLDTTRMLLCYEACYVICDMGGVIGIQQTTWFLEKCVDCAFYAPYLILFSQGGEMIEIRYVEEFPGRLVQIITGKNIKLLSGTDDTVYIHLAHPWAPGRQLIVRLVGNDVIRDNASTWYSSSGN